MHLGGCGISPILGKYVDSFHDEFSSQVLESKENDPFDLYTTYGCRMYGKTLGIFHNKYKKVFDMVLAKPDIFHIHATWRVGRIISRLKKKIIMHYHGTDVRKSDPRQRVNAEREYASIVFVSTPDLLDYDYAVKPVWLPNPVDVEIFHKREFPANNKALIHMKKDQTKEETLDFLEANGCRDLDITWVTQPERNGSKRISYLEIPKFLQKYEYLIDLYIQTGSTEPIKSNSALGLQAMAMGMKVISHDMRIRTQIPDTHRPENVVDVLKNYYKIILDG